MIQNLHYNDELDEIKERARRENDMKKLWRSNKKKGEVNLYG